MVDELSQNRQNAVPDIDRFEAVYAIESGLEVTAQHGFLQQPFAVSTSLRCIIAEQGYEVGDETPLYLSGVANSGGISVNTENVVIKFADLPKVGNVSTGAPATITAANWNLVVRCES